MPISLFVVPFLSFLAVIVIFASEKILRQGWEDVAALEIHAAFVKAHQQKVERIAVIARHEWQHWLVGAVKVFLHPQIGVFDKSDADQALQWVGD